MIDVWFLPERKGKRRDLKKREGNLRHKKENPTAVELRRCVQRRQRAL